MIHRVKFSSFVIGSETPTFFALLDLGRWEVTCYIIIGMKGFVVVFVSPLLRIYERANGVMMEFTYFIRLFELLRIVELLH
jgi:hypothetical protein